MYEPQSLSYVFIGLGLLQQSIIAGWLVSERQSVGDTLQSAFSLGPQHLETSPGSPKSKSDNGLNQCTLQSHYRSSLSFFSMAVSIKCIVGMYSDALIILRFLSDYSPQIPVYSDWVCTQKRYQYIVYHSKIWFPLKLHHTIPFPFASSSLSWFLWRRNPLGIIKGRWNGGRRDRETQVEKHPWESQTFCFLVGFGEKP